MLLLTLVIPGDAAAMIVDLVAAAVQDNPSLTIIETPIIVND
jgi:hypothetical protein